MNLPSWLIRILPAERYRATFVLLCGGLAGYLSPPLVQALTDRWQFPMEVAEIEQLRADVGRVPCGQVQQVLSLVITKNIEIARKHMENRLWYTDIFVSDRWDQVRLILLPCEEVSQW